MAAAIEEALAGAADDEIPVGCVIVKDGEIIARAHNTVEKEACAVSHAEINAIKKATEKTKEKFLSDCAMFVTLEPCAMCAGAIINSRIGELYYGVEEPKTGCCGSNYNILNDSRFNFQTPWINEEDENCRLILQRYFDGRRKECLS